MSNLLHRVGRQNQKGVALLFFVMIIGVLLAFLMIIVNTGTMVYQKMRLQSAVDLASYAGASVQASYLGNGSSKMDSIQGINNQILGKYQALIEDLHKGPWVPWPTVVPIPGGMAGMPICMALCTAANYANAKIVQEKYSAAGADLAKERQKIMNILKQLPEAARKAAEATIKLNIPDLDPDGGFLGNIGSRTTNKVEEVVSESNAFGNVLSKKSNAVLSFQSSKAFYLANVVGSVPNTFPFYGSAGVGAYCVPVKWSDPSVYDQPNWWYCPVNGSGILGGQDGYESALLSFARSVVPDPRVSGNTGSIATISDSKVNAIRLGMVLNPHKPDPYFVAAAEWYPPNGTAMNLENALGAKGSLFPKQTRLAAISAAEPYGASLFIPFSKPFYGEPFGVRLQSIRKLLLDPRMSAVKNDFPGMYDYFESLAPRDRSGKATEKSEDVIRRFLH